MSKFKIEKGVSRINRVKLQAAIEEPVAAELALMCEWSEFQYISVHDAIPHAVCVLLARLHPFV
jgi:hypothetical protein